MNEMSAYLGRAMPMGPMMMQGAPNPFLHVLPEVFWDKAKDYFGYTANFLPAAASIATTVQTNINSDSAFVILAGVATVTDTNETARQAFLSATVQIQDQTSGRTFFDQPTHFHNVFGTAEEPAWWQLPRLVFPSSTLSTTLGNLQAIARNVRCVYLGFKVFNVKVEGDQVR